MTGNPSVEDRAMAEDAVVQLHQQGMLMAVLHRPDLAGSIGQIVAANDYASMFRTEAGIRDGSIPRHDWHVRVGSYARMELCTRMVEMTQDMSWGEGWYVAEIFPILCELWRGSDPDDTDPRFEDLFKRAKSYTTRVTPMYDAVPLGSGTDPITVYRGEPGILLHARPDQIGGLSWTTDINTAIKFATGATMRSPHPVGTVLKGEVRYEDVLAYITGRGEWELIVPPEDVRLVAYDQKVTATSIPPLNWYPLPARFATMKPLIERTQA